MMGGLNNISQSLLKNLGGLGGGGLGGLGGLGNLMGMMGGNNSLGGLGSLMGMMNSMGNMGGNNNANPLAGLDLNALLSQLGNMQQQYASSPEDPPPQNQQQSQGQNGGAGMPNINPELLQMLNNFMGSQGKQQGSRNRQAAKGGGQNAYRQANAAPKDTATSQHAASPHTASQHTSSQHTASPHTASQYAASQHTAPQPMACSGDTCFNCPLGCPRAGLKLPAYGQVRQLARGWSRY